LSRRASDVALKALHGGDPACLYRASLAFADALTGHTVKQPTNWTAIGMFVVFVILTLAITKWAASRGRSRSQF
jgi:hypothetical protein